MKTHQLGWRATAVGAVLCLQAGMASADEWTLRQIADVRYLHQELSASDLVPSLDWIGARDHRVGYVHRLDLSGSTGRLRIKGQARLLLDNSAQDKARTALDLLSIELDLDKSSFIFAGRRHFVQGASLGLNPADVFLNPLEQDRSLNETRRRLETRGVDALGAEVLASDRLTLSGFVAPAGGSLNEDKKTRAGLSAVLLVPEINTDLSALAFWDARPGLAVSMSSTLGDAWVIYADTALRKNRSHIVPEPITGADAGAFAPQISNDGKWYAAATLGVGLTQASGITYNLEYSHQADGYSSDEWRDIAGLIGANAQQWRTNMATARARGRLLTINGILRAETLRRNYLFGRAFIPPISFWVELRWNGLLCTAWMTTAA